MGILRNTKTVPLPPNAVLIGDDKIQWKGKRGKINTARLSPDRKHIIIELETWQIQYRDENGLLRRESPGIRGEDAARFYLARKLAEIERIKSGIVSRIELEQAERRNTPLPPLLEKFRNRQLAAGVSETTVNQCLNRIKRCLESQGIKGITDITAEKIESWVVSQRQSRKRSVSTINNYISSVKNFCNWAADSGYITKSPAVRLKKQNSATDRRKIRRAYTEEELEKIFTAARQRNSTGYDRELVYYTLVTTGLRSSELSAAVPAQIDFEHCRFRVDASKTKNRKADYLPLHPLLANRLKEYIAARNIAPAQPIFGYDPEKLYGELKRDLTAGGIPIKTPDGISVDVHSFRKTFGTMLARAGVPLTTTQRLMRHSTPEITANIYIEVAPIDLVQAVGKLSVFNSVKSSGLQVTGNNQAGG